MIVELDKKAMIDLVCGQGPNYSLFDNSTVKSCGIFNDNRGWSWDKRELDKYNEYELYELYKLCRSSWD